MPKILIAAVASLLIVLSTAQANPLSRIRAGIAARQVKSIARQVQTMADQSRLHNSGEPLAISSQTTSTSISEKNFKKLTRNVASLHKHLKAVGFTSPKMASEIKILLEQVQPPSVFGGTVVHQRQGQIRFSGEYKLQAVSNFAQAYSDLYLLGKSFGARLKPFVFLFPHGDGFEASQSGSGHRQNGVILQRYQPQVP